MHPETTEDFDHPEIKLVIPGCDIYEVLKQNLLLIFSSQYRSTWGAKGTLVGSQ